MLAAQASPGDRSDTGGSNGGSAPGATLGARNLPDTGDGVPYGRHRIVWMTLIAAGMLCAAAGIAVGARRIAQKRANR